MARVVLTPAAVEDLEWLIRTHSLARDTNDRIRRSLGPLRQFPLLGQELGGRWAGFRFALGPWRWMIVVYVFDDEVDRVSIVTIQDGRAARSSATSS